MIDFLTFPVVLKEKKESIIFRHAAELVYTWIYYSISIFMLWITMYLLLRFFLGKEE